MPTEHGGVPCPKPPRRSRVKRKAKAVRKLSRAQCKAIVLMRTGWHCERCGRGVTPDCEPYLPQRAHFNEKVPRSLGGSPFDPANVELICNECHMPGGQHAPTKARMRVIQQRLGRNKMPRGALRESGRL